MISETPRAMMHKGTIDSATEDEIRFRMLPGPSDPIVWNRKSGSLVIENPNGTTVLNHCFRSDLRPVMSLYDEIYPP